jgi:hypothetical protein
MFQTLLILRLTIVDSCNYVAGDEQDDTARAWADILEAEAAQLAADASWLPDCSTAVDGLTTATQGEMGSRPGSRRCAPSAYRG